MYDEVVGAVGSYEQDDKLFFLDGPGGTGKSHVLQKILAQIRLRRRTENGDHEGWKTALAVATSGIAALLLSGRKTAHSTFKIPIQLTEESTCNVYMRTHVAHLLRKAELIVWDEAQQ